MVAYDPFSAEVMASPFEAYRELLERCPVHRHELDGGDLWTAVRHGDVELVARDHTRWTAATGQGPRPSARVALFDDPPAHTRLRRIVQAAFSAPRVAALEPMVTALTDELLDGVDGRPSWDLHDALAEPLPVIVIARLLGVPEELRSTFKHWSDEILAAFNDPSRGREERRLMQAFFDEQVELRRSAEDPPDDLTTVLSLTEDEEGRRLTTEELWSVLVQLLIGGNETTTSGITNLVWRLLEDRDRWDAVLADRSLVDAAVEESLRHDPPVLGLYRRTVDDTELSGTPVPAGARMMMCYGAANRDRSVFEQPDEFRLDRPPGELRRHLAFGTGPHVCVGAALARLEMRVALSRLVERFPALRPDGPTSRIETYLLWGRRSLPVAAR